MVVRNQLFLLLVVAVVGFGSSASYSFTPEERAFFNAAREGDINAVEFYVSGGLVDINATDENNQTALDNALSQKQYKVATLLRSLGGVGSAGPVAKKLRTPWKIGDVAHNLALLGIAALGAGALVVSCYSLSEQVKLLFLITQCQHNELLLQQGVAQLTSRMGTVEGKVFPNQGGKVGGDGNRQWLGLLGKGFKAVAQALPLVSFFVEVKQGRFAPPPIAADSTSIWETVKGKTSKLVGKTLDGASFCAEKIGAYALLSLAKRCFGH